MSKAKETTPLIDAPFCLPSKTEYIQPFLMMMASGANVVGGFFAIAAGADHVKAEDQRRAANELRSVKIER